MTKNQIIIVVTLIVVVIIFFFLNIVHCFSERCPWEKVPPPKSLPKVILTFVGPWDSAKDWADIAERFNRYKKSAGIDVVIQYKTLPDTLNYEENIREMQFENDGPNIYTIYHSWVPRYAEKLLPMPAGMITLKDYQDTYAKVAFDDLVIGGKVYALPLYIDTPILFYNQDKFFNEGYLRPPATWEEFKDYTEKLTILEEKKESGSGLINNEAVNETVDIKGVEKDNIGKIIQEEKKIKVAGAAIGGGSNVNRSQDILMLMIMQNNMEENFANQISFNNPGTFTAIKVYTDFTDPAKRFYTWNEDQMYSIDAFSQRKAAMMINYTHHIKTVQKQTGNTLNFKVAPVPQFNKNYKANYASYWVPVVPRTAPCRAAVKVDCYALSWEFLNFAAQKENVKFYLDSTNTAAANLELAQQQANNFDDMRSVSASQVFTAKSWKRPDENLADKVLKEMINSIITKDKEEKKEIREAMNIAAREIVQLN